MGFFSRKRSLVGKHVLITGGSKGIGLSLAKEFVCKGSHVSIVARNAADLRSALEELNQLAKSKALTPRLNSFSADTMHTDQVSKAITDAQTIVGPIDILVCNAGLSIPGLFVEQDVDIFERQVNVNYLGTVRTIKAAIPAMLARAEGHIVIISSVLSVTGLAGYSSYAPSKWALRGLADCLFNELQGTGVKISIAYPPDTDTPGYATENETKPELCHLVNDAVGSSLYKPEQVASTLVSSISRGDYHIRTPDFAFNLLVNKMSAISPKAFPLLISMIVAPIVDVVTSVIGALADRAACKYNKKRGDKKRGGAAPAGKS